MKLLGRDIPAKELLERLQARVRARGLEIEDSGPIDFSGVEPRVDPLSFNLSGLEEYADPTRPLPLHTHRTGLSRAAVLLAKQTFRRGFQVFINEAFGRQRMFNAHVRDAYAQLAAEVLSLKEEVAHLHRAPTPSPPPGARSPRKGSREPRRQGS